MITTDVELQILRRYAAGSEIIAMANELGLNRETVVSTVSDLAGFQRGRARELVRQYEAAHHPKPQSATLAPVPEVKIEPRTDGPRSPVETILARAVAAGGRYAKRAAKIREQITALDAELAGYQQVIDAERQVQDLRRQLDEAAAKLRALKTGGTSPAVPAAKAATGTAAEQKAERRRIREWAAEHGIPCPARGYIPGAVMERYRAAHGQAAA